MYLFLRVVLVSILAAMALAACEFAPTVLTPIFALFYFIMLIYFFVFTMWSCLLYTSCSVRCSISKFLYRRFKKRFVFSCFRYCRIYNLFKIQQDVYKRQLADRLQTVLDYVEKPGVSNES